MIHLLQWENIFLKKFFRSVGMVSNEDLNWKKLCYVFPSEGGTISLLQGMSIFQLLKMPKMCTFLCHQFQILYRPGISIRKKSSFCYRNQIKNTQWNRWSGWMLFGNEYHICYESVYTLKCFVQFRLNGWVVNTFMQPQNMLFAVELTVLLTSYWFGFLF